MKPTFLEQASIWGRVFEVAVQRGVLAHLLHQGLLADDHTVLADWRSMRVSKIYQNLTQALGLSDKNAKEWATSGARHLLVLGYGLGWSAMRECLSHSALREAQIEAIWCPLVLPGEQEDRDQEIERSAQSFQTAFNLPTCDSGLLRRGHPGRADFLLWLSSKPGNPQRQAKHEIFCFEFSHNTPGQLADFTTEAPHREELNRYARYIESRGVFSRICAQVEGEAFTLSSNLAQHLSAFSGTDKPLFKLCQASSYTERLIYLLQACGKLQDCQGRAIAVTSNGFESLAARFSSSDRILDPRVTLMKSLGAAYRNLHKLNDEVPGEMDREIRLVFNKLVRSLPADFKEQAQQIAQPPDLGGSVHYLFKETVTGFFNPMQALSRDAAIAAVDETEALIEFFGGSPKQALSQAIAQQGQPSDQIPLRQVHAAAVVAGLESAQTGRVNVIALEGNPGIGKTTAVTQFLKQTTAGYLFLYVSPRVVINRDVTAKLAQEQGESSGILTLTTNANLIASAPQWHQQQGHPGSLIDSAVVVDGVSGLQRPVCNTLFLTPQQEHEIDCEIVTSSRSKQSRNQREDSVESKRRPGVLRTLAISARRLLNANPQVNRLVMTAAIQGYRTLRQGTTIDTLGELFSKQADTKAGIQERLAFSRRIPTIIVMVDELAGDGAGVLFARRLADWLQQQFIDPFEATQAPFKVVLIISDASLSNEVVLNNYLKAGDRAPDKVLISKSQGEAPFRVTGTRTKVGSRKHPTLHVMTNSYPASQLKIDYSIRLSPIDRGMTRDGKPQTARQAIREQSESELIDHAIQEIQRGLDQGATQIIFFAQDKAFLRQVQETLTMRENDPIPPNQVAVLDQSVPPHRRLALVQEPERDEKRVFLMTSSGARGISFPKTDWIIAWIPRFKIEAALMEVAQLIYRGRGWYSDPITGEQVSGDHQSRQLVMLINDFIVSDESTAEVLPQLWLRQASDLLTLLVMLRSTIHTRIKGDAGLRRQRIAFVPVGAVGDEEILSLMSHDVRDFLREAEVFVYDAQAEKDKAIVRKAEQLTRKTFARFNLKGQASTATAQSYVNYQTLEALSKGLCRSTSPLLPALATDVLSIPECLSCLGPFWVEDWSERQAEERFSFEGWRAESRADSQALLGLLRSIFETQGLPPKLKRPAKELYKLLIREKEASQQEYSTLQAMRTKNIQVGLPLDYTHFWRESSDEDDRLQGLEDPETWRNALGRALTAQGLVMPIIPQYQSFPWVAVTGQGLREQLENVFGDLYFIASSELNLLNTILLEDEETES